MSVTVQAYMAALTQKSSEDLIAAIDALPADKQSWSPLDKGRSALDQAAECAILNGITADLINTHAFPADFSFETFVADKQKLAEDWASLKQLLEANTAAAVAAIEAVKDEDLEVVIEMPWGARNIGQIIAYPYWNMSYHEGQTNFIATLA
jgi:uncharacterized damage-inducible protein DinB